MNPAGAANLGNAYGKIVLDASGVQNAVNEARNSLNGLQNIGNGIQSMGQSLTSFGTNMTVALAPVTGFVTQGIFAFSRFQDVMTEISARTGLVGDDLEAIRQAALRMGAETAFSATQAAEGILQLTSSGLSAKQSIEALPNVLALAAAGALDLGYAADAFTDIVAQFNLDPIDEGIQVVNALNAAAAISSATVGDLILGFQNAGPVANLFGLSVEDTAAALAIFADSGIKGAEAGTQLKSMLTNMTRDTNDVQQMWRDLGVSMFDATGNARPLNDILQDLNLAMEGMSDEERIRVINTLGGAYGQTGLSALLMANGIDAAKNAMGQQASAADVAAARMNTFSGRIESLKGSIETLSINFLGPLVENYLTPLAEQVIELINSVNDWVLGNEDLAATIALIVGGLAIAGPIIAGLGMYLSTFGSLIAVAGAALGFLLSPIGLAVAAVVGLGAALMYLTDTSLSDLITMLQDTLTWITTFTVGLYNAFRGGGLEGVGDYLVANLIAPLVGAITNIDFAGIVAGMATRLAEALNTMTLAAWGASTWAQVHIVQPLAAALIEVDWADVGAKMGQAVSTAFADSMEASRDTIGSSMNSISERADEEAPKMAHSGGVLSGELVGSFLATMITALPSVAMAMNQFMISAVEALAVGAVQFAILGLKSALEFSRGFIEGMLFKTPDIANSLAIVVAQIALFFMAQYHAFIKMGGDIIEGIKQGILNSNLGQWFVTQFNTIVAQVKQFLGIASPSTLFAQIGHDIGQGLINGLVAMVSDIGAAAAAMYNAVVTPLNNIITLAQRAVSAASGAVSSVVGAPIGGSDQREVPIPPGLQLPQGSGTQRPQATGGPVRRGESLLVGELGPEPFTPNANGGIMPNDVWEAMKNIASSLSGPALASAINHAGGGMRGGDVYQIAVSVPVDVLRDEPKLQRNAETFAESLQLALQKRSVA